MTNIKRPEWAQKTALMRDYYDHEWGVVCHDDRQLFEMLSLETYQIGLSWQTVLNKRNAFEAAFHQFEIEKVAAMTVQDVTQLLQDPAIIRNRRKIESTIHNAQVVRRIQHEFGSLDHYLWHLVDHKVQQVVLAANEQLPPKTKMSEAAAKRLKLDGFKLVGPVTVYSFMQATGMVNARL